MRGWETDGVKRSVLVQNHRFTEYKFGGGELSKSEKLELSFLRMTCDGVKTDSCCNPLKCYVISTSWSAVPGYRTPKLLFGDALALTSA